MAITSGFFDSIDGDRRYDADQMSNYFDGLVSDGVYQTIGDALVVRASGDGLNITIGSGRALVKTHWMKNDAPITRTLAPANVQYPRRDGIFIRYSTETRNIDIVVVEGTPSASPSTPSPVRNENTWDLLLADVYVEKNATTLNQSAIRDERGSSLCPWVTGLIKQVDTSQLFLQFQSAYEEQFNVFDQYLAQKQHEFDIWFADLTGKLQVDTMLHEYRDSYVITSKQQSSKLYPFTLDNYEPGNDILFVIVDGIVMTEDVDFKIIKFDEHYPDIDGDGHVDASDASAISDAYARIMTGQPSGLTERQEKAADADMNGMIDASDVGLTQNFYSATAIGTYQNNLEGWKRFIEDTRNITIDSEYYIIPLKNAYRSGSQMTIRIIKSVIGEGSTGISEYGTSVISAFSTTTGIGGIGTYTQEEVN